MKMDKKKIKSCFVKKQTLCWSCKNACGKCPWSACDKETRELKWQPVEGWHAIRTRVLMHTKSDHRRKKHYETSYCVLACPQYEEG